jgi:hypothetical protein
VGGLLLLYVVSIAKKSFNGGIYSVQITLLH